MIHACPDFSERDMVIGWNKEDIREAGKTVAVGHAYAERRAAEFARMTPQQKVDALFVHTKSTG